MTAASAIFDRAATLRGRGLTDLRVFWQLRREFQNAERDVLVRASRLEGAPRGVTPGWALWGQPLRPCQIRFKAKERGRPEEPVTVRTRKVISVDYPILTVEANDIRDGDWIEGVGLVETAFTHKKWTFVSFANDESVIYKPDAHVKVRIEDRGETMERS